MHNILLMLYYVVISTTAKFFSKKLAIKKKKRHLSRINYINYEENKFKEEKVGNGK